MDTFKGYSKVLFLSVLLTVFVTGCGGGGSGAVDPNSAKAITAYSLAGVSGSVFTGTINEPAKTITVAGVPVGTDVTALVATFTTTAKSVMVGTTLQTSSITPNNFTSPVSYTFTAIDGTSATYTVTVVPTTAKTITAYSFVGLPDSPGIINESAKTITVIVPSDTDLTTLTTSAATVTTTAKRVQKGAAALNKLVVAPDGLSATDTITITAADGTSVTYTVIVTKATSSAKAITAFAFVGFTGFPGTINEAAKTITVNLPSGTDVRTLTATFTTAGKTVTVGSAVQTSGAAPTNNFTTPVAYTVTAVDGSSATYTVTVTVAPSSAKEIIAYSFAGFTGAAGIINEAARTIAVTVPNGTDVTALAATFTTTGNIAKVGTAVQTSTATVNNFTTPVAYTVTAVDGSSATYTVTVTVAPGSAKAITAYSYAGFTGATGIINEAARTIAVTVPNGTNVTALAATFTTTGTVAKVGTTVQTSGATANNFTSPVAYTITAADGTTTTYTVTVTIAPSSAKAMTAFAFAGFTGAAGVINEAARTIAVTVPNGTNMTALIATFTTTGTVAKVGTTVQTSGATANNFTTPVAYTITAADGTTTTYTVTVTIAPSSAKALTAFAFAGFTGAAGVINEAARTIAVTVPNGTNVTALIATFTTTGTVAKVGTTVQTSGATANNFTSPVAYTITAADGTTTTYTVTVTIAPSSAKALTAFAFAGFTGAAGVINEAARTIAVTVPNGTNVTALIATFTTTGTVAKVGTTVQTSGATANNFTTPVAYTITAADGTTTTYTVTVTIAPSSAKALTAFAFAGFTGAAGVINEAARTIAVTVPNGTNATALIATFTTTGTVAKVGTTVQTSGATANNFTTPVAYTITAADGTTTTYAVTVTIAPSSAKALTAFEFVGFSAYPGIVDEAAKTIAVTLPYGADVTALTAKFTTSGTVVKIGSAVQTSEAPPTNDFTTPKAYTVTAADGTTTLVPYTVTVTIAAANPTAPTLGETARFVILASQKVTTTAGSAISNGDIGIEDQARSYYAGFTPGANPGQFTVLTNGLSYAHDDIDPALIPAPYASTIAFINQVRTDLGIAYSFLAADPNPTAPTQVCPIELGGRTLTRGVYKTGSNVGITTGALHLDAQGDPNAVFIFTTDGTLTIGAPSGGIVLDNLAQAKNVYFRVAGITTIEAGIIAYGNIFSWQQVNLLAGASITGRLFSVNEQVTLIANAVTKAP